MSALIALNPRLHDYLVVEAYLSSEDRKNLYRGRVASQSTEVRQREYNRGVSVPCVDCKRANRVHRNIPRHAILDDEKVSVHHGAEQFIEILRIFMLYNQALWGTTDHPLKRWQDFHRIAAAGTLAIRHLGCNSSDNGTGDPILLLHQRVLSGDISSGLRSAVEWLLRKRAASRR